MKTSYELMLEEALGHLAKVPFNPSRPGIRDWKAAPRAAAEIVRLYGAADQYDRARMYDAMAERCSALKTSLLYFRSGLVSDGTKPWPEIQAELAAMGVPLAERAGRGNKSRRPTSAHVIQAGAALDESPAKPEPAPQTEHAPTREARRAAAKMYALLEQHFEVAPGGNIGTYADGWSDEHVAQESGMSVSEVVRTREDVHGRLAEDPRLADVEAKIEAVRQQAERDLADLAKMGAAIREQVEAATAELRRTLDGMRKARGV